MDTRPATHAGSWYTSDAEQLNTSFAKWIKPMLLAKGGRARIIVAPHAGYTYCGKILGKSYSKLAIDANTETIYVLGPSHQVYFHDHALLTTYKQIDTPLGAIPVDTSKITSLQKSHPSIFKSMDKDVDDNEHSLEMQFSAIKYLLNVHSNTNAKIVPMMISHNSQEVDFEIGDVLKEEMSSQGNSVFVVSSDFCHWGSRFRYMAYVASKEELWNHFEEGTEVPFLNKKSTANALEVPIYKSIEIMDKGAMSVLEENSGMNAYTKFKEYLEITGNTICGEKPLSVILAALRSTESTFRWNGYEQSSQCTFISDSSVSYAAGYCHI